MATIDYKEKYEKAVQAVMLAKQDTESAVTIGILEEIFPELKEMTYNDVMRKMAIKAVHAPEAQSCIKSWGIEPDDVIAWLEKQGEEIIPLEQIILNVWELGNYWKELTKGFCNTEYGTQLDYIVKHWKEGEHYIKSLKKQGEQNPANKVEPKFKIGDVIRLKGSLAEYTIESISGECYHGKGWGLAISGDNEYELVRHKSVEWSEEDETGLSDALWAIQQARAIAKDENDMGNLWYAENWLKSLKDRVQPKQEWSEDDNNHVKSILSTIECCKAQFPNSPAVVEAYNADIEWLNSLRPQNTWKPSDEQMAALSNISITGCISYAEQGRELINLYNELKKLREE